MVSPKSIPPSHIPRVPPPSQWWHQAKAALAKEVLWPSGLVWTTSVLAWVPQKQNLRQRLTWRALFRSAPGNRSTEQEWRVRVDSRTHSQSSHRLIWSALDRLISSFQEAIWTTTTQEHRLEEGRIYLLASVSHWWKCCPLGVFIPLHDHAIHVCVHRVPKHLMPL